MRQTDTFLGGCDDSERSGGARSRANFSSLRRTPSPTTLATER